MPTKAELYAQMADKVATQLTGSWQEWAGFLTTASRLYKYPFHEQLMIYAQRPDATACAEYDLWNEKMGRYVRRGSKGIALVDDSGDRPRLRYVFDISDTGTREHSRTPWLWQLEERHLDSVQVMLERTYDVSGDDLAGQLTKVAGKLAEEYWTEHQQDFFYIVDGSFLEEYDEFNVVMMLGLEDKLNNMPNNLSGGQQQRVAIARALITKPAIVLADEPTGNLDSKTSSDVIGLLKRTSAEFHQTIVMITHNDDIARLADRIIRIEDGKITGGMEL